MPSNWSRRSVIAAGPLALLSASGCLFGAGHRGRVESVSGQVANSTPDPVTVTVTLATPDGTVDLDRTYRLPPNDVAEFEVDDPATEYALSATVDGGPSESVEWDVTPCASYVHVGIEEGEETETATDEKIIDFSFSVC